MSRAPITRAQLDGALGFTLTDEQWLAVTAAVEPAVIVAGAGSGKTTSMAARVAWLVGSGMARPDAVLGLTFTTKATAQLLSAMRGSLAQLADQGLLDLPVMDDPGADSTQEDEAGPGEPQVLTYHAFASRIVAEHGIRLGREPGAALLADGTRHQLAHRVVCGTSLPLSTFGRSPVDITGDLLSLDDDLTELGITPDRLRAFDDELAALLRSFPSLQNTGADMLSTSAQRAVLADLVEEWRAEKGAREVMDFADQIRLAREIVDRYPDVVSDLRRRYGVVLLDEYQDTSIAQRLLLQRVFGDGHPVMAVGDPCQAIYGWRGASVDNIDSFPRHFPVRTPGGGRPAGRYSLTQNRRSGPAILEVANRSSVELRAAHPGVEPLRPGDNDKGRGRVSCALFATYDDETAWLVQQVAETGAGGAAWQDIAVLAATGRDLVAVDAALRRRGIPTQLVGAAALLAQPAVIDLRSMLEIVHDPTANPAFVRLASGPRWRIGVRDLAALGARAAVLAGGRSRSEQGDLDAALDDAVQGSDIVESVSLTEALDDLGDPDHYSPDAIERFGRMERELHRFRSHVGEPLPDLVLRVMRESGLEIEASLGVAALAVQQQHALAAFQDLAAEFTELEGRLTLGAFLSRLRDAERFDVDLELEVDGPADAVQLLTVHKAKGMEYPYVFVPFVAKGAFPGGRSRPQWPTSPKSVPWPLRDDVTDDLASFPDRDATPRAVDYTAYKQVLKELSAMEARRLAYVAFTRAERGLVVTGHWWGPSQKDPRGPDAFLESVRQACLDGAGEVVHWAEAPPVGAENPQSPTSAGPRYWPAPVSADRITALTVVAGAVASAGAVQDEIPGLHGVPVPGGEPGDAERMHTWHALAEALVEEAEARGRVERTVRMPDSVSASLLMRALADPESVAVDLVRPMPRPPAPAAARGTEFHAWVETRYGQQSLLDPDDLPGSADEDITSDERLAALKTAFDSGPYAALVPVAVEEPFAVLVGGRVVNGRIDAVFEVDGRFDVIDWKTGSARHVDPLQLALYRLAWSRLRGVPVAEIDAAFVIVGTGEVIRPDTDVAMARLLALT